MNARVERGRRAHRHGMLAESRCVWFLRAKGYRILARRYRTPVGELDIVATRGSTVIFVEVKARASVEAAAGALTPKTMSRMQRAAQYFIVLHPALGARNLRMDVMFITPSKLWPIHVQDGVGVHGL